MPKYTNEEVIKILYERKPNIRILDELPNRSDVPILCECINCKTQTMQTKRQLLHDYGKCSVCDGKKIKKGFNDLFSTNPNVAKYYDEDFSKSHTQGSEIKGEATCPICGTKKMISPAQINRYGLGCQVCSDGISYPNKYGRAFLMQLPIDDLCFEYSPEWVGRRFYDNYFKFNNKEYIVEMDGGLGHNFKLYHNEVSMKGIINDHIKDSLAAKHNIEIIRIDCKESNSDYIKNNIINSKLNLIFDLSNINWEKCAEMAEKNLIYEICKEYQEDSEILIKDLAKNFGINPSTASYYLKKGNQFNLCNFTEEEVKRRKYRAISKETGRKVNVIDFNGNNLGIFDSVKICAEELKKIYKDIDFKIKSINSCILKNQKYKGFTITLCKEG